MMAHLDSRECLTGFIVIRSRLRCQSISRSAAFRQAATRIRYVVWWSSRVPICFSSLAIHRPAWTLSIMSSTRICHSWSASSMIRVVEAIMTANWDTRSKPNGTNLLAPLLRSKYSSPKRKFTSSNYRFIEHIVWNLIFVSVRNKTLYSSWAR